MIEYKNTVAFAAPAMFGAGFGCKTGYKVLMGTRHEDPQVNLVDLEKLARKQFAMFGNPRLPKKLNAYEFYSGAAAPDASVSLPGIDFTVTCIHDDNAPYMALVADSSIGRARKEAALLYKDIYTQLRLFNAGFRDVVNASDSPDYDNAVAFALCVKTMRRGRYKIRYVPALAIGADADSNYYEAGNAMVRITKHFGRIILRPYELYLFYGSPAALKGMRDLPHMKRVYDRRAPALGSVFVIAPSFELAKAEAESLYQKLHDRIAYFALHKQNI